MGLDSFRNPDKGYREVPFWAWNDHLSSREGIVWKPLINRGDGDS